MSRPTSRPTPQTLQRLLDSLPAELDYLKPGAIALYWAYRRPDSVQVYEDMDDAVFRADLYRESEQWPDAASTARQQAAALARWLETPAAKTASHSARAAFGWIQAQLEGLAADGFDRERLLDPPPDPTPPPVTVDVPEDLVGGVTLETWPDGLIVTLKGRPRLDILITTIKPTTWTTTIEEVEADPRWAAWDVRATPVTINGGTGLRLEATHSLIHANGQSHRVDNPWAQWQLEWPGGVCAQVQCSFFKASDRKREQVERIVATLRLRG